MNFEVALALGLLIGIAYALSRRFTALSGRNRAGRAMLLKWPSGIGRASIMEVKAGTIHLSSPVMRTHHAPPKPGTELILKPLGGGTARRAKLLLHDDDGWVCRFVS